MNTQQPTSEQPGISRRRLLGIGGGVAAASVLGGAVAVNKASSSAGAFPRPSSEKLEEDGVAAHTRVAFYGDRQAGIVTPAQDRLHFAAFDLLTESRADVISLLRRWTEAAATLTEGAAIGRYGAVDGPASAPPEDTGEALDLPPSRLTITFGFGRSLFKHNGADRFGLANRLPERLIELPHFPGDRLDPMRSDGDLCVQACADDPQVAVHAIRNLARMAFGVASVRWSQLGFGRTSSTSTSQVTPRNLFGFKDGTANLKGEVAESIDEHVWVQPGDDQAWLTGGSFLVARRINMRIETWDRTSLAEQEAIIGRQKGSGAPLSGGTEFTPVNFDITGRGGKPLVALDSHVRLASPASNDGHAMLRRGYNFIDGSDGLGRLDAGLFFLAYVRNPVTQFVPVQTNLARNDALSEYLQHTGSALFAIPAGIANPSSFAGEALFG